MAQPAMTPRKKPPATTSPGCVHVTSQIELDAAMASGACIHVRNDAEESVKAWAAERMAKVEADRQAGGQG